MQRRTDVCVLQKKRPKKTNKKTPFWGSRCALRRSHLRLSSQRQLVSSPDLVSAAHFTEKRNYNHNCSCRLHSNFTPECLVLGAELITTKKKKEKENHMSSRCREVQPLLFSNYSSPAWSLPLFLLSVNNSFSFKQIRGT